MIYAMKKIFGILFLLFFISTFSANAEESSVQLKDNLNLKIDEVKSLQKDSISAQNVKKQEINNQFEINKNSLTNKISVKKELQQKTIQVSNEEKYSKDNSLNVILLPQVQIRPEGIIYQETQRNIDVMDPQKDGSINSNYPGLRGPNQLVVYTPSFGLRTGTNEFGTEAIVEKNMVVRLNGADSIIPKNGFVISGHGTAKKWIIQNIFHFYI